MELNDTYYSLLKSTITEIIKICPFNIADMSCLYQLSRSLIAELTNTSYSQEYIYWVVNDIFYNRHRQVNDIDET